MCFLLVAGVACSKHLFRVLLCTVFSFLFALRRNEIKRIRVSDCEHNRRRTETFLNEMRLSQKRLTQFNIKNVFPFYEKKLKKLHVENTIFDSTELSSAKKEKKTRNEIFGIDGKVFVTS